MLADMYREADLTLHSSKKNPQYFQKTVWFSSYKKIDILGSWKIAWSCHGAHGHYYNVVRILIIQPTLLISNQVVVRYLLKRNMLNESIRNYPKAI